MNFRILKTTVASAALLTAPLAANALTISTETDGDVLADALFLNIPGLTVTSTELIGFPGQAGLYTNVIGTYGLPQNGIVFSSGDVLDYQAGGNADSGTTTSYGFGGEGGGEGGGGNGTGGGCGAGDGNGNGQGCEGIVPQAAQFAEIVIPISSAATPSQEALLQPITGEGNHNDVIQLNIEFETASNVESVTFFGAFGSEEWPEYVGDYVDGFGLYVNGVNEAGVAEFNGGTPLPVNIDHPSMAAITGTELDGVLAPGSNPVLRFDVDVLPGATNNFTIILADANDSALDTTVYLSSFIAANPGGGSGTPVPATGATEFDPLLPITTAEGEPVFDENGGFTIDIAQEIADQGQLIWVDPVVSIGYTYEVAGGALITTVTAPSFATIADIDGYMISDGVTSYAITASQTLNILDLFGVTGLSTLYLTGIDTSLNIDPADPLGFPLGLTFANVTSDFQVTVTPETFDTDPAAVVPLPATGLLYIGAVVLGGSVLRRRQKA